MYHSALTSALSDASHGDDKASTHRAHPGGRAPHRRVRRRLRSRDRAGLRRRQTASSVCRMPRITAYLPLLAHRFARERLRACGLVEGSLPKSVPVVLFVCTHNTRRSQLAAALLARAAGNWVLIASAGTAPASAVAPAVLEVLGERSIDQRRLPQAAHRRSRRRCRRRHHDGLWRRLPDPSRTPLPRRRPRRPDGADIETVRAIRDGIEARVQLLLIELLPTTAEASS
jgi:arsenate reductase (thioredoxin)